MTLDLDEIERIAASNPGGGLLVSNTIPALVAEVKRLREQLGDCESVHDAKITYHNPALQALQHEYERMRGDLAVAVAGAGRAREALQAVHGFLAWLTAMGEPTNGALELRRRVNLGDIITSARAAAREIDAALDGGPDPANIFDGNGSNVTDRALARAAARLRKIAKRADDYTPAGLRIMLYYEADHLAEAAARPKPEKPAVHDLADPLCSQHEPERGDWGHCDTCAAIDGAGQENQQ